MRKLLVALLFVVGTALPASAGGEVQRFTWDGTGAEHIPCAGNVSWVMAGEGITAASVGVNDADGVDDGYGWAMTQGTDGNWSVIGTLPLNPTDVVTAAYIADALPTLTLVGCDPATVVIPPTTGGSDPAPTPGQPERVWELGFRVRTIRPTNVVAKYRIVCDGVPMKGRVRAMTPLSRTFTGFEGADTCRIRVVAWDIPPHVKPHEWPAPIVTTFVEHS